MHVQRQTLSILALTFLLPFQLGLELELNDVCPGLHELVLSSVRRPPFVELGVVPLMMSCCCWSSVLLQAQLLELARHRHCPVQVLWVESSRLGLWIQLLSELGLCL